MPDRERELDELFAELAAIEPEPRSGLAEKARRRRISSWVNQGLAPSVEPARSTWMRVATWGSWAFASAAAALLMVGIARFLGGSAGPALEPEPITRGEPASSRVTGDHESEQAPPPSTQEARPSAPVDALPRARGVSQPVRPRARSAEPTAGTAGSAPWPPESATTSDTTSLAVQNGLFQQAVRAARRGDDESALAGFDVLLGRFPDSPLAADSWVRKFRTLGRLGRTAQAKLAAEEYLARYPQGFAASEAAELVRSSSGEEEPVKP